MTRNEYIEKARELYENGEISAEAFEAMITNADVFAEEEDCRNDFGLPPWYAEIEYDDLNSLEAVQGMRFDDMNYMRYMER